MPSSSPLTPGFRPARAWAPALMVLGLCASACGGGSRDRAPGTPRPPGSGLDAQVSDVSSGIDGGTSDARVGPGPDAGIGLDAGAWDGGPPRDSGAGPQDTGTFDAGPPPDSGPPAGSVNLTFTGCSPDFGGEIVVSYNGSLAIGSLSAGGSVLTASLQFDLGGFRGPLALSTAHRVETGVVVNLIAPNTWTNIAQDSRVYTGEIPDPITGTLLVTTYQPSSGVTDITFNGVTLQNVVDDSICRIDGRVTSSRIGR